MYAYESLTGALMSIVRQGPSELFRGFLASSLRDAPYAGLFIVFYEGIKREACTSLGSSFVNITLTHVVDSINHPTDFEHPVDFDPQSVGCICRGYCYNGYPSL